MCGCGEVEDMVDYLKSHINKFHWEKSQERAPKRKSDDERRVEIKIPKIKKRMMLINLSVW